MKRRRRNIKKKGWKRKARIKMYMETKKLRKWKLRQNDSKKKSGKKKTNKNPSKSWREQKKNVKKEIWVGLGFGRLKVTRNSLLWADRFLYCYGNRQENERWDWSGSGVFGMENKRKKRKRKGRKKRTKWWTKKNL